MIADNFKRDLDEMIVEHGGPYSTISFILSNNGPLKKEDKRVCRFILDALQYIISVRHISFGAINDVVIPYNIYFLDGKFHLVD